jgi:hypothetical protein
LSDEEHQYERLVMSKYNDAKRQTTEMKGVGPDPDDTSLSTTSSSAAYHNNPTFQESTGNTTTTTATATEPLNMNTNYHQLSPTAVPVTNNVNNNNNCNITASSSSSYSRPSSTIQIPSTDMNHRQLGAATTEQLRSSSSSSSPPSSSSFAQLAFRTFETYINETRAETFVPPPLQEMICGYGEGLARLAVTSTTHNHHYNNNNQQQQQHHQQGKFLEPIALRRHIHSTPLLRHTKSQLSAINNDNDEYDDCDSDEDEPPPAGLEILDHARSRSTPLSTSKYSAFGSIPRTNSQTLENNELLTNQTSGGGSAFSMPPYAMLKASNRSNERPVRSVIFNPIQHEDEILTTTDCDELGEMTSIEVTNVPFSSTSSTNRWKEEGDEQVTPQLHATKKKSAASRAAKFLTDVRNLRISSGRPRDGRENPARPPSISSDESPPNNCNITVSDGSTDRNDLVRSSVGVATSTTVTSTTTNIGTTKTTAVCDRQQYSVSSPEPSQIVGRQGSYSHPQHLQDSPETANSFPTSISSSSGYATTSNSSNGQSHGTQLSAISETDREVANVNHLQRDQKRPAFKSESPGTRVRMDGASVRADRFFRDGARLRNLPPFSSRRGGSAQSPSVGSNASLNTSSTGSSRGDDAPPTIVSYIDRKQVSDLTSLHLRGDSLETSSPRAGSVDRELRDSSPSDMIEAEHSDVIFEGAHATKMDVCNKPRFKGGLQFGHKIRSLPPRSPCNGLVSSTTPPPPPIGSPSCSSASPPRQIIGHRVDPTDDKPYVVTPISSRLDPKTSNVGVLSTTFLPDSDQGSHEIVRLSPNRQLVSDSNSSDYYNLAPTSKGSSPVYGQQLLRTYGENSIEILKTDSKEDSISSSSTPLVTPDKAS